MSLTYWFVPHTHWDREWYLSFQDFRWKLVRSVDEILGTLQADPRFEHFMLDGQTIVLEDYLELRPGRREELADLIRTGRIAVGPWYVQPDDILVTGEALIRNLERGLRIAREFGDAMMVGYLPDSFGHCASLPAILRGFGLDAAALMRGAGPELSKAFFGWSARDGSRVLVAYLVDSYGNGADLPTEPAGFLDGLAALEERQKGALFPGIPLLVMNGIDHRSIASALPRAIEESGLRESARIGSLAQYAGAGRELAGIPEWTGELRSAWRFPVVVGCTSARHWIKREDQAVSSLLEREAEPLAALGAWLGAPYPAEAIELAWKHLLQNQAHDSICGCSIDAVHEDMRYRYAQARGLGIRIASEAAGFIASRIDSTFAGEGQAVVVAVNPAPARRAALLSFSGPGLPLSPVLVDREGRTYPGQLLSEEGGSAIFFDERFTPRQLRFAMGMVKEGTILEFSVQEARASWESSSVLRIDLELGPRGYSRFDWNAWVRSTAPLLETPGLTHVHAVGLRSGLKRILFVAGLPSFGAKAFHLRAGGRKESAAGPSGTVDLRIGRRLLQNHRYRLRVRADGSLDLFDAELGLTLRGINRIVDDGDRGDEYNHDSVPVDRIIGAPSASIPLMRRIRTDVVESGPVRATLRIRAAYRVPASIRRDRRARERRNVKLEVVRFVSLVAGGDRVEFRTEIDNQARDHRMRVHFPLGEETQASLAGGTFGAVQRPPRPEPAPQGSPRPVSPELGQEEPSATHPFTGFVACGAQGSTVAVLARGSREYEVLQTGGQSEITVTLFRCIGWLSRADLSSRRGNAGPDTPTPGAQEIGRHAFEYALFLHAGPPAEHLLSREWEEYRTAPRVALQAAGTGDLGDGESLLTIDDQKLIFSSLRRMAEGVFSIRAFDTGGSARTVEMRFSRPISWARKTGLDGTPICPLPVSRRDGGASAQLPVGPWEIATVEFGHG